MNDYRVRVRVDHESAEPVYQQIADILHTRIQNGTYQPGHAIPSIERIRQETGCAVKTIRRAIGMLAADGLVVIVPGKGTFVARQEGGQ